MAFEIVPPAVPARIAHQFGADVVLVLTMSHADEQCRWTYYGRTDRDKELAERLSRRVQEILSEHEVFA